MENTLQYIDSKTSSSGRPILCKLRGVVADCVQPTRNGRRYSNKVWEHVFNSDIVKEMFENGGVLGELNHPEDRLETDLSKIAICMPEPPVKNKDGLLEATVDVLDTPNGRIVDCLARYGYNLGISSRGDGDIREDFGTGESEVVPESYDLKAWDIVALPAVKSARLHMVNESLDQKKSSLKKALNEQLERSTPDEKKIMMETLNDMKIDYSPEKVEDKVNSKSDTADDVGVDVVKNLQESLKQNRALEDTIRELNEKLSVCYAKEVKLNEELNKYKSSVISLSDSAKGVKALKVKIDSLNEQLEAQKETISNQNKKIARLTESQKVSAVRQFKLNESLDSSESKYSKLEENFNAYKKDSQSKISSLNESLEELKQDSAIKSKEYSQKLSKANKLVEHYKGVAKAAVDKYIDSKAKMLGVSTSEIKNRLNENYSFSDIDKVCEDLRAYKLNISNLPFGVSTQSKPKVKITESKEPIKPRGSYDDTIDDQLLNLINR